MSVLTDFSTLIGMTSCVNAQGMTVNCWTVNKESDISEMADIGVDMITTDHPDLIRDMQNRR